ncbi:hypothetical protein WDU94_003312 [Cyamophila willieti]
MNYKHVEIIRNFLPLYYLSKIFGVFPLLLLKQPAKTSRKAGGHFWNRFSRSKISDPGDETKEDILEKFKSYKTYLKESAKMERGTLKIFRLDRINLIYTYFSICVVILHGISAPFYVLHTTLPLQYNDSIFNIDLDEEEDDEDDELTTVLPTPGMNDNDIVEGNATDSPKVKIAKNILKNSANKRSVRDIDITEEHSTHENILEDILDTSEHAITENTLTLEEVENGTISPENNSTKNNKTENETLQMNHRNKRNTQTYRNSFNKTLNGFNRTNNVQNSWWRSNNNTFNQTSYNKKNKISNGTDLNATNREINATKISNETVANDPLKYDQETKQSLSMKIANPLMITVMCLGSKFTSIFFFPQNLDKFFSQLLIVDKVLKYHPKFHANQKHFMKNLLIYSFLLSVPINIHYLMTVIEVNNEFGIMWCCILIYKNLSSFLLDLQFIYFNYLLFIRYKYINREITTAFSRYSPNNVVLVKSFLIHDYLEILRECHKKLSDLLKLLNYIYQIHLLFALSACFLKLLFNIYFAMFGYVIGTAVPHSDKEATELFRTVLWSMYYAMRFLCVVMSAEMTGQQAKRTNIIVANVNSRHLDSKTKEELSLFSAYVTSRELKYTAAGFFSLNSHLITSAISTGTTYLVILVQFHGQKL